MSSYAVTQKHARFRTDLVVDVLHTKTREVERLSLANLSLGGAFVRSSRPAAPGSVLGLRAQMGEAPFGATARVVHVVDVERSAAARLPAGMGVQFERLRPEAREALERYLSSLAPARAEDGSGTLQSAEALLRLARRVLSGLDRCDVDDALGLAAGASDAARARRTERLVAVLSSPPPGMLAGERDRVELALRGLTSLERRMVREQVSACVLDDPEQIARRRQAMVLLESAEACLGAALVEKAHVQAREALSLSSSPDVQARAARVLSRVPVAGTP